MARRLIAIFAAVLLPALMLVGVPAHAAPMPTTTTLVAGPAKAVYGSTQSVTVTVKRSDGQPYVGPVDLQWTTVTSSVWTTQTVSTAADGTYRHAFFATSNRTWRAIVPTSETHAGSSSAFVASTVVAPLQLTYAPARTELGTSLVVRGKSVYRPYTGVKLWKLLGSTWSPVATVPIQADGTFSFSQRQALGSADWRVTFDSPVTGEFVAPAAATFTNRTWTYFYLADVRRTSARYWYASTMTLDGVSYPRSPYAILQPTNNYWNATFDLGGQCWSVTTRVGVQDGSLSTSKFTVVARKTVGGTSSYFAEITRSATSSASWRLDVEGATALTLSMQHVGGSKFRGVLGTPRVACWAKPPTP